MDRNRIFEILGAESSLSTEALLKHCLNQLRSIERAIAVEDNDVFRSELSQKRVELIAVRDYLLDARSHDDFSITKDKIPIEFVKPRVRDRMRAPELKDGESKTRDSISRSVVKDGAPITGSFGRALKTVGLATLILLLGFLGLSRWLSWRRDSDRAVDIEAALKEATEAQTYYGPRLLSAINSLEGICTRYSAQFPVETKPLAVILNELRERRVVLNKRQTDLDQLLRKADDLVCSNADLSIELYHEAARSFCERHAEGFPDLVSTLRPSLDDRLRTAASEKKRRLLLDQKRVAVINLKSAVLELVSQLERQSQNSESTLTANLASRLKELCAASLIDSTIYSSRQKLAAGDALFADQKYDDALQNYNEAQSGLSKALALRSEGEQALRLHDQLNAEFNAGTFSADEAQLTSAFRKAMSDANSAFGHGEIVEASAFLTDASLQIKFANELLIVRREAVAEYIRAIIVSVEVPEQFSIAEAELKSADNAASVRNWPGAKALFLSSKAKLINVQSSGKEIIERRFSSDLKNAESSANSQQWDIVITTLENAIRRLGAAPHPQRASAENLLRKAVTERDKQRKFFDKLNSAELQLKNMELEAAERSYRQCLEIWPDYPSRDRIDTNIRDIRSQIELRQKLERAASLLKDANLDESLSIYSEILNTASSVEATSGKLAVLEAMYDKARCLRDGDGVDFDYNTSAAWFLKAAKAGHAPSQFCYGRLCAHGLGVNKNEAIGVQWEQSASDNGYCVAQIWLGRRLLEGDGIAKDVAQGQKLLDAGRQNIGDFLSIHSYPEAFSVSAWLSEHDNDKAEAEKLFRRAADMGYAPAEYTLGVKCASRKENLEALSWLSKAVEKRFPPSYFQLARIYLERENGDIYNFQKGVELIKPIAERGDPEVQNFLGYSYWVEQSFDEAVYWYKKAADQGYAPAEFNLSVCYNNGSGFPAPDPAKAQEYLSRSAAKGWAPAIESLNKSK